MSNNPRLHANPADLELVRETTPHDFREWTIEQVGGRDRLPQYVVDRIEEQDPEAELAPLLDAKMPGDQLWLCRSKKIGPLYGNEGVCLLRDGLPILYLSVIHY